MRFGLTHGNIGRFADPEAAGRLAVAAEASGFDSLWTIEHVVLPTEYEPLYPETADGRIPFAPDHPIADPLVWMAFVAARTTTIKLGTAVLVLPQRNALITAKEVATLDRLSGGRTLLGVGAGWLREEFDALRVGFEDRGRRMNDTIGAMRALWSGEPADFTSDSVAFQGVVSSPRPHGPSVPIHIGGFTVPAAIRAGRLGDGFFPGGYDLERLDVLIKRCRKEAEATGRDPDAIEITSRWTKNPAELTNLDTLHRLADLGVDRVTVSTLVFDHEHIADDLARFQDTVIAKF
ncbi:LLM class F420-dependent oxidoreductase [Umezawaea sp. NPDC059074]|uniref:LLM class F420-dependent oxidoreductase n=1 Tax=Umezawaea sp. NPDC059074 TaxID=3346716 RepID=UPI00367FD998